MSEERLARMITRIGIGATIAVVVIGGLFVARSRLQEAPEVTFMDAHARIMEWPEGERQLELQGEIEEARRVFARIPNPDDQLERGLTDLARREETIRDQVTELRTEQESLRRQDQEDRERLAAQRSYEAERESSRKYAERFRRNRWIQGVMPVVFGVLAVSMCIVVSLYLWYLPYLIAKQRSHPQMAAIRTTCGLGWIYGLAAGLLVLGSPGPASLQISLLALPAAGFSVFSWPVAMIWAHLQTEPGAATNDRSTES